ncbi:helix-turn-helix domain-containing protein [Myroides phaeus]|uniref:Helix-turn-helix domain-containing protein n=1 Tax=Myroides phaeus TaxID=702745 RepID=A0A1G8H1V5_9FLAO|nr:helix-turn-helix domain-containing protein [Myroides phaeus]SDI00617.1 Helix-turn-helix domain-containing protein [Myroides phaeus]
MLNKKIHHHNGENQFNNWPMKNNIYIIKHSIDEMLTLPIENSNLYAISYIKEEASYYNGYTTKEINKPCLFFSIPSASKEIKLKIQQPSVISVFFEKSLLGLNNHLLYKLNNSVKSFPLLLLNEKHEEFVRIIVEKIEEELDSCFPSQSEQIKRLIELLIYKNYKIQPIQTWDRENTNKGRVCQNFLDLLEMQFPVTKNGLKLQANKPSYFADKLNVHINYLNYTVNQSLNISTSQCIKDRIISESKNLLHYTEWSISEIAFTLGFQSPGYFSASFKKETGLTPNQFRKTHKIIS